MASNPDVAALAQLGHDITSLKLYVVSVTALWVYDYFLTLADEVHYAWKTERTLIFVLFLVTRYLPPVFHTWVIITQHYPGYSTEVCQKSAFLQVVYYSCIAAAAQIVLTQRAYAITAKNKWVAAILYAIFTLQIGVGIYMTIWSATGPITQFPPIPLDAYRSCLTRTSRALTVLQMSVSLSFDIVVFVLVVVQTRLIKSRYRGMGRPNLLNTFSRDAEIYFGVITTSHFLIVVVFAAARPGIGPIPIVGNAMYIPMMISRMIISLKKAASRGEIRADLDAQNPLSMGLQDIHSAHRVENVRLSTLRG
ncbi:hypothetical protein BJ322DRAFT_63556 [Thelephora terrestris]|uniref:DUF6533 domain-containing protein n=1 Tax=Thelephora terrestris TaxID=56493 RepID=A0A9P6LCM9_9AGAM|nr:hypothetical protein BJ322DRAFT_63556 [Thelephora terrestris]